MHWNPRTCAHTLALNFWVCTQLKSQFVSPMFGGFSTPWLGGAGENSPWVFVGVVFDLLNNQEKHKLMKSCGFFKTKGWIFKTWSKNNCFFQSEMQRLSSFCAEQQQRSVRFHLFTWEGSSLNLVLNLTLNWSRLVLTCSDSLNLQDSFFVTSGWSLRRVARRGWSMHPASKEADVF